MGYRTDCMAPGMVAITPSDTTMLDLSGFYVGGAGNVAVECDDGSQATFTAPPVGTQVRNLGIRKILSTGTTATLILGFKK